MKNRVTLIILLFLSLGCLAQTHKYRPMPEKSAAWKTVGLADPQGNPNAFEFDIMKIKGDTIINNLKYVQLDQITINNGKDTFVCTNCPLYIYRNDTIHKKVYHWLDYLQKDTLIFDFTLNVGDTIKNTDYAIYGTYIVSMIDSVLLADGYHRRWFFGRDIISDTVGVWIEGIGNTSYFGGTPGQIAGASESWLVCFSHNDTIIYNQPLYYAYSNYIIADCDSIYIDATENINYANTINIYPNPASDNITISFNRYTQATNIRLYNLLGECVYTSNVSGSTYHLPVAHLPNGVYILQLNSADINTQQRIVISH